MQLQFQKSTVPFLGTAVQAVKNTEVTQEVRLSDGLPDIGRTLNTWGQIILRSKEWQGDLITLSGSVMVWSLYAPEDGTEPRVTETRIPFQLNWETDRVDREGPVLITPLLRFADSRSISARKMMVRAGIAALAQAVYQNEAEQYAPVELPEDIQILKNVYPLQIPTDAGEKTFLLDEELMLPAAEEVEKLLGYTVSPEITDKRVLADKVIIKGSGNLHLVYRDGQGKVHGWDHELPFSQLAELNGSYGADAQADVRMAVTGLEADMAEPGKIRLKCALVAQYLIRDRKLLEVVEDAYSPYRTVEPAMGVLELPVILEDRRELVTAQQALPGEDGQVTDAVFYPDYPRQKIHADTVGLELPGLFQTLCYGENGSPQVANTRWEGSVSLPIGDSIQVAVTQIGAGKPQSVNNGDGLLLMSNVWMQLQSTSTMGIPMVTGLETGEPVEPDAARPSLILQQKGEDSLWQIAKETGSTVAAISEANKLEGEPEPDRMLLIPVS